MKQLNDSLWGRGILLIFCTIFFCAIITGVSMSVSSVFAGDVDAGKKVFRKCKACHTIKEGGRNKIGPNLYSVVGSDAGTVDGFKYSKAMRESGIVWNEDTLRAFLAKPKKFVPGNKMPFSGLKKSEQIENVITYMIEKSK
jgi:cytochrome c2